MRVRMLIGTVPSGSGSGIQARNFGWSRFQGCIICEQSFLALSLKLKGRAIFVTGSHCATYLGLTRRAWGDKVYSEA